MNAPLRQFASPYARKLARDRGIALVDLQGSGPSGRIVAADVLTFVKPVAAPEPAPPEPSPVPMWEPANIVAALATGIDLGRLADLVEQFAAAKMTLPADALLLRAAARSLAALDIEGATGWETGKGRGEVVIADAAGLSFGALQSLLDGSAPSAGASDTVALSIRRLKNSGIRAVFMPLRPGHKLRLVLTGDGSTIDCLLAFDTARLDEDSAVEFLARFKDDLETPLRLLA
jgi:pyruvate dehydrogenase E2 component (dihydrolipoamide acetyltransferase)